MQPLARWLMVTLAAMVSMAAPVEAVGLPGIADALMRQMPSPGFEAESMEPMEGVRAEALRPMRATSAMTKVSPRVAQ